MRCQYPAAGTQDVAASSGILGDHPPCCAATGYCPVAVNNTGNGAQALVVYHQLLCVCHR
eukprot:1136845-Pelagomonas_calceolata.AAC.4